MIWILLLIIGIIGGLSEAIKDTITFKFDNSVFKVLKADFWNPHLSWKRKYVEGSKLRKWAYKTILVWVSDAWHLTKVIETVSIFIGLSVCHLLADNNWMFFLFAFIFYTIKKSAFEIFLQLFKTN